MSKPFQVSPRYITKMQGGPSLVRLRCSLGAERFERFWFSVLTVLLARGFCFFCVLEKDSSGSGFGSSQTVPEVPVPLRFQEKRFWQFQFRVRSWATLKFRNSEKGALEKGYLHKIVQKILSNLGQFCGHVNHCDVQDETPAILRKFGAQFATNLPIPASAFPVASQLRRSCPIGFGGFHAVDTLSFRIRFLSSIGGRLLRVHLLATVSEAWSFCKELSPKQILLVPHRKSGCRKRGAEFKGGSRHDRNRHNRHNRRNHQDRQLFRVKRHFAKWRLFHGNLVPKKAQRERESQIERERERKKKKKVKGR